MTISIIFVMSGLIKILLQLTDNVISKDHQGDDI